MSKLTKLIIGRDVTPEVTTPQPGEIGKLLVVQDATGGHKIILPEGHYGNASVEPTPNKTTLLTYTVDDIGIYWQSSVIVPGSKDGESDYVIDIKGTTITAYPRKGSALKSYTGTNAYTVIQSAINALQTGKGGKIHLCSGNYSLSNELTITGWDATNPPAAQLCIEGEGFATVLTQNTAGKNGIIVKNKASFALKNLYIYVGDTALSGILLSNSGSTSEISTFGGVIDGVEVLSSSTSAPAVHIINTFDLVVPYLTALSTNNTGILIEGSTAIGINYGNSHYGFIRCAGANTAPHAGIKLVSHSNYHPINLNTFDNLETASGYYGIYLYGACYNTFLHVDSEYVKYPIYIDGIAGNESLGNRFNGGYIYPQGEGAVGITAVDFAGGNFFGVQIEADGGSGTVPINDMQQFMAANRYDVTLAFFVDDSLISIHDPNTVLSYRAASNGTTVMNIPNPALSDISNKPATTFWTHYQGYATKNYVDTTFTKYNGDGANGKWGIDIYGEATLWGGVEADFLSLGNTPVQIAGFEEGTYKAKPYTPVQIQTFLGLGDNAFASGSKAPLASPGFTGTPTVPLVTNPAATNATIANTAFVQSAIVNFVQTKYVTQVTPSGTVNSENTVFSLPSVPIENTESLFLNGIYQRRVADYNVYGDALIFNNAPAPGTSILINYFKY
ncbi:hypothetical protein ACVW0P_004494 [Mucilaginibacter sp. UYNi724]